MNRVHSLGGGTSFSYPKLLYETFGFRRLAEVPYVRIPSDAFGDDDLRAAARLPGLTHLDVRSANITDESVRELANARVLRHLSVSSPRITDAGLAWCGDSESLTELNVTGVRLKGVFLSGEKFSELRELRLNSCDMDDSIAAALSKMRSLRQLGIYNVPITKATLNTIESLPALEQLEIDGTRISIDDLESLAARRPYLEIFVYEP